MNHVPYAQAFNASDTRVTFNRRLVSVGRSGDRLLVGIGSNHDERPTIRYVDFFVADSDATVNADLYFALKPGSSTLALSTTAP